MRFIKRFLPLSALAVFLFTDVVYAQQAKDVDLKCTDSYAASQADFLISTRSFGDYELKHEWSDRLSSNQVFKKKVDLTGGLEYVFFLTTDKDVDASALEIRDDLGNKIDFEYKVNDLDKDMINFFFTADYDGSYYILFRVVNSHQPSTCTYMGVLEGDSDSEDY